MLPKKTSHIRCCNTNFLQSKKLQKITSNQLFSKTHKKNLSKNYYKEVRSVKDISGSTFKEEHPIKVVPNKTLAVVEQIL